MFIKQEENMYTIKEIIEVWQKCYGEDMMVEYPHFVRDLGRTKTAGGKATREDIKTIAQAIKQTRSRKNYKTNEEWKKWK
mgnify:CR=1 FL=1